MRLLMLAALILAANISGTAQEVSILPYPLPTARYEDLKKHLALTDAQVNSLSTIANAKSQAQQALYTQINDKYTTLNNLLASGSSDSVRIGQLMIEINQLRKQTVPAEPYRSQAMNLLTADQKTKLPILIQALQLQNAAWQASSLNLIDNPSSIGLPRPMPVDFDGGIGSTIGATTFPTEPNN
jgi:Spy/CpxP family protein refolding chaperone